MTATHAGPRPYSAYKDSALPWLARIPSHWEERRAKYFLREVDERSTTGTEELLSVSHVTGVTPRSQKNVTMFKAESYIGHKLCRPADLVINTMWAWMAALGVAKDTGLVSPSYGVYRPLNPGTFVPAYMDQLLRTEAYRTEYICDSTGIRGSRLRLYPEQFLRIPLPCPPYAEQMQMLAFLNAADRRIGALIRVKRRLIGLLNERKQAIIHHAVTRGLDQDVPLKPSGVSWLGDVPEHWGILRLVSIARSINTGPFGSQLHANEYTDGGTPVINPANIRDGRIVPDPRIGIDEATLARLSRHKLAEGDIILGRRGEMGRCAPVTADEAGWLCGTGSLNLQLRRNADAQFLAYQIALTGVKEWLSLESVGSTMDNLNTGIVGRIPLVLPPLYEQRAITDYVHFATADVERTINRVRREIDLLREYRTRLIADVITGKLDVRDVLLPDGDTDAPDDPGLFADNTDDPTDDEDEGATDADE